MTAIPDGNDSRTPERGERRIAQGNRAPNGATEPWVQEKAGIAGAMKTISEVAKWMKNSLENMVQATFSIPLVNTEIKKVTLRPVKIAHQLQLQVMQFDQTKCFTKNIKEELIEDALLGFMHAYQAIFVRFVDAEYNVTIHGQKVRVKRKAVEKVVTHDFAHNRKKKYLLPEGVFYPALYELQVLTKESKVRPQAYDKFKQINHFLEIVLDHLSEKDELTIIDFGCGKAYLTFALYEYLQRTLKRNVKLIGVDSKKDVILHLQQLVDKLGYKGLTFVHGTINDYSIEGTPDAVIALHACDTATDQAISQAVKAEAKAIFVAPCCQHELYSQLTKNVSACPILLEAGLFRERFGALLTDALRVELLEAVGYKCDVIEFVDPVHTPKNTLIRAVRKGAPKLGLGEGYRELVSHFGVEPLLERLLFGNLKSKT